MTFAIRRSKIQPTARYKLDTLSPDLTKPIVLIGRHAGESNPAYWNELMKQVNAGRTGGGRAVEDQAQANRIDYADRFARTVITGWENVTEDGGAAVPCTPENVRRFFDMLIAPGEESYRDVFDAVVAYFRDVDNFRAPIVDAVELGKK